LDQRRSPPARILSLRSDLEYQIRQEDRRFKPRRGFYVVKDWDGSGIRTNRQVAWRASENWRVMSVNGSTTALSGISPSIRLEVAYNLKI
jgi:hypothetical protein